MMSTSQSELTMKSNDPVVVHEHEEWRYEEAPRGVKVQLLTIGDIAVYGEWKGKLGEFYKGWHPVPRRNKKKEEALDRLKPSA